MNIRPYLKAQQFVRLKNGRAARYFNECDPNSAQVRPVSFICDGEMIEYDYEGGTANPEHEIEEFLPPIRWGVDLSTARLGQLLLLRGYRFAYFHAARGSGLSGQYFVRHEDDSTTVHSKEGWTIGQEEHAHQDVVGMFTPSAGVTNTILISLLGARSLLTKFEHSLRDPKQSERKKSFDRMVAGLQALLTNIKTEISE